MKSFNNFASFFSSAALCLVLATSFVSSTLTDGQIAAIEDIIVNKFMGEQGVPGMSISVVQGDSFEQIYARGYGYKDLDAKLPATNETLFGIGSLSKVCIHEWTKYSKNKEWLCL